MYMHEPEVRKNFRSVHRENTYGENFRCVMAKSVKKLNWKKKKKKKTVSLV